MAENGELSYYFQSPTYEKSRLFWKDENDPKKLTERLTTIKEFIFSVADEKFTKDDVTSALWDYAEEEGRGQVLWPLRVALSGREKSPDPFQLASIFGKEETLKRIQEAIFKFNEA